MPYVSTDRDRAELTVSSLLVAVLIASVAVSVCNMFLLKN